MRAGGADESEYLGAIRKLRKCIKDGHSEPEIKPECLALDMMTTVPKVFQHRSGNLIASDAHVTILKKALERHDAVVFSPVTICWIGHTWCCIDGHHRLKAYESVRKMCVIPVQVFSGTLDEAIGHALAANSKDKLPMQVREKSEAAWRLVVGTSLSKAGQSSASGMSESQIALMRRVKMNLIKKGLSVDMLADMRWFEAMLSDQGKTRELQDTFEDYVEEQGRLLANRLTKAFGKRLTDEPAILAKALSICQESLPTRLVDAWEQSGFLDLNELLEERKEEKANSDF